MPRTPKYSLHKATGQARFRMSGKDHYLGEYGSPERRDAYDELILVMAKTERYHWKAVGHWPWS